MMFGEQFRRTRQSKDGTITMNCNEDTSPGLIRCPVKDHSRRTYPLMWVARAIHTFPKVISLFTKMALLPETTQMNRLSPMSTATVGR